MTSPDTQSVQFEAAFDRTNFFKGNADGSGTLLISVPASEAQSMVNLWQDYREQDLIVTIVKKGTVLGKKAE